MTQPHVTAPASASKPALADTTKPEKLHGVTDCKIKVPRKVTYVLHTPSKASLEMPYAVAVNGVVDPRYSNKPAQLSGGGGKVEVVVQCGDKVSLYLNSDAHPDYRQHPVYAVTPTARDVRVTIREKKGKHADADTPVLKAKEGGTDKATSKRPEIDEYDAPLTGDIWMKVSHKYTEAEVAALVPSDTGPEVLAAVKKIYAGLKDKSLNLIVPAKGDKPDMKISVVFEDANNPLNNITDFDLLRDGLPRVHPAGFASMFNSALTAQVSRLNVTSNWRPMEGSIAHRAGLGLDVNFVDDVRMNRQELANPKMHNKNDDDNVSAEERKLYEAFLETRDEHETAKDASAAAAKAEKEACAALKAAQAKQAAAKTDAQKAAAAAAVEAKQEAANQATTAKEKAEKAANSASKKRRAAEDAWADEKSAREPARVTAFRGALLKCMCVEQLFDPWYMDVNTQDKAPPTHNKQLDDNEKLHSHHLHITVHEPKIR
ncbi:hypothetical protein [Inhella proteolytica]|uniref:Uncharacterized protein n=1 Tax=Inhella proteolytica TaxID=2795029 RepID=A0A931NI25_9BURK|nr:hypothetical protein [Inhella proteolytica]MBH9578881.1 hypothetical protein [Inhella proteolytica]